MSTIEMPSDYPAEAVVELPSLVEEGPIPRPRHQMLWIIPTLLISGISWLSGGNQIFNDAAMVLFAIACLFGGLWELRHFRQNLGVAGIVVFWGTLIWFCHDYFTHWFQGNYGHNDFGAKYMVGHDVIAKAIFLIGLFMECAVLGFYIPRGRRLSKMIASVPEPSDQSFFYLILVTLFIGLVPYIFFVNEPILTALYKDILAMRGGAHARWMVGRTGNLNYNWGAYVLRLLDVGFVGGILAACYAAIIARSKIIQVICWAIWLFWTALSFGGGSRGPLVAMVLPVIGLIVLKGWVFQRKHAAKPFIQAASLSVVLLFFVQFQAIFRNVGVEAADYKKVEMLRSEGNLMFSEPLLAYDLVPSAMPHSGDVFIGAQFIRPLPEMIYRFGAGWIPRALWTTKANSLGELIGLHDYDFHSFYNQLLTGGAASNDEYGESTGGGTVCTSIVGMGYIPYGFPGVIQYGLVFGWLNIIAERALRYSNGRIMGILFALGLSTYLFRAFRDLTPHDLYPLLIGMLVISIFTKILSPKGHQTKNDQSLPM